jgi:hypothetical protein
VLCAFAWRGYMLSLERALDGYGDRILVVDSRDLRRRPGALLADIQSFLGLEVRDLAVEAAGENTSFVRGERPALGGVDVLWMNVIAGRVMRRNGYEQRRAPLQPLRLLASVLTLPVSVAYASAVLPRRVPGSFREYLSTWVGRPSRAV